MQIPQQIDDPRFTAFCPKYHYAIELIGRRWTGAILRAMLSGAARFSDIGAAVPGRWQFWHDRWRRGRTSLVNVGACGTDWPPCACA